VGSEQWAVGSEQWAGGRRQGGKEAKRQEAGSRKQWAVTRLLPQPVRKSSAFPFQPHLEVREAEPRETANCNRAGEASLTAPAAAQPLRVSCPDEEVRDCEGFAYLFWNHKEVGWGLGPLPITAYCLLPAPLIAVQSCM
jgi:hypothetical protein